MTLTDELKIHDNKIKANQAQYDLGRETAKISALSSKYLLEKYEYLTSEDLGHRPSVLEKSFKKDNIKNIVKSESDFNYDGKYRFYRFYKVYHEFEEMSLDSKYNRVKEFANLLTNFKNLRPKNPKTQLRQERIMRNVNELYEKYYNVYKNDYDNDDELSEVKKKKIDYKQFELFDKIDKKSKLDGETKKFFKEIENQEKGVDQRGFMKYFSYEPTALVNNLLRQSIQDLRKSLDEIKQQKDELNKNE